MHAQIDATVEQLDFELLGEEALAADLGQGDVANLVALRVHHFDAIGVLGRVSFQKPLHEFGLPQGKLAAPRPQHDRVVLHGSSSYMGCSADACDGTVCGAAISPASSACAWATIPSE